MSEAKRALLDVLKILKDAGWDRGGKVSDDSTDEKSNGKAERKEEHPPDSVPTAETPGDSGQENRHSSPAG